MACVVTKSELYVFIGYFEEPEPGVPDGCTGWYHSGGKFPLVSPGQAFTFERVAGRPVRDGVAGPFAARGEALAHLQQHLAR